MVALVGMTGNVNKSPESETTLTAFGGGDSPANSLAMITTGNAAAQAGHLFLGTNKTGSIFIHSDSQKVQIGRTVNNNVTSSAMLTIAGDVSASGKYFEGLHHLINSSQTGSILTLNATTASNLVRNSVTSSLLVRNSVTSSLLVRNSVTSSLLVRNSVTSSLSPENINVVGNGHITASGNISASGEIIGNKLIIGPGEGDVSENVVISGSDGNLLVQGDSDGGDVSLTIRNSAAGGSTDETTSIIFGTGDSFAETPALIRAGREQVYTGVSSLEDGFLAFHTELNSTIAEKVRITSDGNMGIGISTPTKPLQVQGDISGSGVIQTPNFNSNEIRDIKFTGFFLSTTSKVFAPLHGSVNDVINYSSQENRGLGFVAPYDGYLDKVVVRVSDNAAGSTVVGLHKSADGTEYPNSTATYTSTVNITADETAFNFPFGTSKTFSAGEIIAMSFDSTNSVNGNVNMTMVFVYDITTGV